MARAIHRRMIACVFMVGMLTLCRCNTGAGGVAGVATGGGGITDNSASTGDWLGLVDDTLSTNGQTTVNQITYDLQFDESGKIKDMVAWLYGMARPHTGAGCDVVKNAVMQGDLTQPNQSAQAQCVGIQLGWTETLALTTIDPTNPSAGDYTVEFDARTQGTSADPFDDHRTGEIRVHYFPQAYGLWLSIEIDSHETITSAGQTTQSDSKETLIGGMTQCPNHCVTRSGPE